MNDSTGNVKQQRLVIEEWMTYGHCTRDDGTLDFHIYGKDDSVTVMHFSSDNALAELLFGLQRMCQDHSKAALA